MGVKEIFAQRLKGLRDELAISQTELADKLKVSRGSISFYENSDRTPDIEFLDRVADFFNVSIDYLLGKTDSKMIEKPEINNLGLSDEVIKIFLAMNANALGVFEKEATTDEFKYMLPIVNQLIASKEFHKALISFAVSTYLTQSLLNLEESIALIKNKASKSPADIVILSGDSNSILKTSELYNSQAIECLHDAGKSIVYITDDEIMDFLSIIDKK